MISRVVVACALALGVISPSSPATASGIISETSTAEEATAVWTPTANFAVREKAAA